MTAILSAVAGFTKVATTPVGGTAKINSTSNVLSWTSPNDGALHRAILYYISVVSSGETGGQVTFGSQSTGGGGVLIGGVAGWATVDNGGNANGARASVNIDQLMVQANTTIYLYQSTALSAGASVIYAEIWAS